MLAMRLGRKLSPGLVDAADEILRTVLHPRCVNSGAALYYCW